MCGGLLCRLVVPVTPTLTVPPPKQPNPPPPPQKPKQTNKNPKTIPKLSYYEDGADEVAFLNITGFRDFPLGDLPMLEVLRRASEGVFVPLTVGGGIREFTDASGKHYSALQVAAEYFRYGVHARGGIWV